MRVVLQRAVRGSVRLEDGGVRAIGPGLVLFLGVGTRDQEVDASRLAAKVVHLRVFSNEAGKFDRSLLDTGGQALVVSQFTLYGDCGGGRRPDFTAAAPPDRARPLYERFAQELRALGVPVVTGEFGHKMQVEISNDGPVTLILDSAAGRETHP